MTPEEAAALRAPFPPEQVGKLPKAGMTLDYVSHAWVTERLLQVDPAWSWEPMGYTEHGTPYLDSHGGLWIKLTVCGVSRLGYGTGTGPEAVKIAIGDSLRNAAMRFGVALDLWEKETPEWEQVDKPKRATRSKPKQPEVDDWSTPPLDDPAPVSVPPIPGAGSSPPKFGPSAPISAAQVRLINVLAQDVGLEDRALLHEGISKLLVREVTSVKNLTKREAALVIESLQARLPKPEAS